MQNVVDEMLKIAILDDDSIFLDLVCAKISSISNFTLFAALSSDQLAEILSREKIDCIILDYNIGEESGLSIKKRLDSWFADHPPIIMITGDGRERTAIKAFQMGVADYLPKRTLSASIIVASVAKAVERHRRDMLHREEHRRLAKAAALMSSSVERASRESMIH